MPKTQNIFGYNCLIMFLVIIVISYFVVGFNKPYNYVVIDYPNGKTVVHEKTGFYFKWFGKTTDYVACPVVILNNNLKKESE